MRNATGAARAGYQALCIDALDPERLGRFWAAALVSAGATVVRASDGDIGWTVLADPEGNELRAFRAESDVD